MSLPGNQAVLPPPSQPATLTYGEAANIDALNSYPNGYTIDLTDSNWSVPSDGAEFDLYHSRKFDPVNLDQEHVRQSFFEQCGCMCRGNHRQQASLRFERERPIHGRRWRQPHHELRMV
jgi:hypothetical protein